MGVIGHKWLLHQSVEHRMPALADMDLCRLLLAEEFWPHIPVHLKSQFCRDCTVHYERCENEYVIGLLCMYKGNKVNLAPYLSRNRKLMKYGKIETNWHEIR